jgi:hypothetical protein
MEGVTMLKRILGLAVAGTLLAASAGCPAIFNQSGGGGGGGMGAAQDPRADTEPTDDTGADEFGTHHHPRYHPRKRPGQATN